MKTLYLLRHATAEPAHSGGRDIDRPLAARGLRAAAQVGHLLRDTGAPPALVLCSPARRATETLARLLTELGSTPTVVPREDLYLSNWPALLQAVQRLPNDVERVLVVAHNPGLHDLAHHLAGTGSPVALKTLELKFPPGSLAVLSFPAANWSAVAPGTGTLTDFVRPHDLNGSAP